VLEVSELLAMIASQSDLIGLVPRSMLKMAGSTFDLVTLPVAVTSKTFPIKLIWSASRTSDPAQMFIRKQIELAARAVTGRGRAQT
jgi:DNA-binding transcriptional LysR family regulator